MGRRHAASAARAGGEVVAVVDVHRPAAAGLAARTGPTTPAFDDLPTCLETCGVDVVHICTPAGSHEPLVDAAIAAGLPAIVEKPLAASVGETHRLLDAATRAGVAVAAVHQFPFQHGVRRLLSRRELFGEIVRVGYRTSSAGGAGRSAQVRAALLCEIVPHAASLFQAFAPGFQPSRFNAIVRGEDLALLGRHGETILDVHVTLRGRPPCNELYVTGTHASGYADLFHGFSLFDRGSSGGRGKAARPFLYGTRLLASATSNGVRRLARHEPAYPGLHGLIAAFYAAVERGAPAPVSAEEMLAAAALVDLARPA